MKILHLYKDALPDSFGGVETFISELTTETSKLNFENVVLSTGLKTHSVHKNGTRIEYLRRNFTILSTPISLDFLRKNGEIRNNFDIIHLHYPYPFADMAILAHFTKQPLVISFHSEITKQKISKVFYEPIKHQTFKKAKALVFSSNNLLTKVVDRQTFANKSLMIPLGIKTLAKPSNTHHPDRKDKKPYALFIGVHRYYKGLDVLLDAAKHLQYEILIVGDGPHRRSLEKRKADENIYNVKFLGQVEEKRKIRLLNDCRVLVLPSTLPSEAFGLVILEAFSLAKPVITCELGTGTSEIVDNGINGYLVDPRDHISLAEKMALLLTNRELAISLGQAGYSKFKSSFRIEDTAQRYAKLYERIKAN